MKRYCDHRGQSCWPWPWPDPAVAADPVKIGVLVPLTGIVANGGKEMANGIDMAAKDKKGPCWAVPSSWWWRTPGSSRRWPCPRPKSWSIKTSPWP